MKIHFYKYQGTGNDFIVLDNRANTIQLSKADVQWLCNRKMGIGADGLMLLQAEKGFDFKMVYYNADGNEGSMCGNGGRCLVQFAHDIGIVENKVYFTATDGIHEASIDTKTKLVSLKMNDVKEVIHRANENVFILNTGSPHYIQFVDSVAEINVYQAGKAIRYNDEFNEQGINVNFAHTIADYQIEVRTYERGVEDETLSCGTGVTAAALASSASNPPNNYSVKIKTLGGNLTVDFLKIDNQHYQNIWLTGAATFVYKGEINIA